MVEKSNIREHSLFKRFYQADEKVFINANLVNSASSSRDVWSAVNVFLGKIYEATHSIPAVGSIVNNINSPAKVEIVKIYYSIYESDILITVDVKFP